MSALHFEKLILNRFLISFIVLYLNRDLIWTVWIYLIRPGFGKFWSINFINTRGGLCFTCTWKLYYTCPGVQDNSFLFTYVLFEDQLFPVVFLMFYVLASYSGTIYNVLFFWISCKQKVNLLILIYFWLVCPAYPPLWFWLFGNYKLSDHCAW